MRTVDCCVSVSVCLGALRDSLTRCLAIDATIAREVRGGDGRAGARHVEVAEKISTDGEVGHLVSFGIVNSKDVSDFTNLASGDFLFLIVFVVLQKSWKTHDVLTGLNSGHPFATARELDVKQHGPCTT